MAKEDDDDPKLLTTGDLEWRPGKSRLSFSPESKDFSLIPS